MNAIDYAILKTNWTFGFRDGARQDAMVAASLLPAELQQDFIAYCERTAVQGREWDQQRRASGYPLQEVMGENEANTADMLRSVAVMKGFGAEAARVAPLMEAMA